MSVEYALGRGVELTARVNSPSRAPRRFQPGMMHMRANRQQIRPNMVLSLQVIGSNLGVELRQVEIDQHQCHAVQRRIE